MQTNAFFLESARESDKETILEILKESGLTTEGIEDAEFYIARLDDDDDDDDDASESDPIIGVVGLEIWGSSQGLLRSLAVRKEYRNRRVGEALVRKVIEIARSKKLKELYLITVAVEKYYERFGFELVDRNTVRGEVLRSAEFRGACLQTASVMRYLL